MFCSKCGNNVGNAKFCSKCGNKLEEAKMTSEAVETAAETQDIQEETVQIATETQDIQEETVQTATETQDTPIQNSEAFFGISNPIKKKKKWPIVVGIIAAVIAVFGISGYFAYPYIAELVSPKAYAVSALKKTTDKFYTSISESIYKMDISKLNDGGDVIMTMQADKCNINGVDYLSAIKEKTLSIKVNSNSSDDTFSGTIGLGSTKDSVINMEFYIDSKSIKLKFPELTSQAISMDISTVMGSMGGISYSDLNTIRKALGNANYSAYMEQYSSLIEGILSDVVKGINTLIDESKYKKLGKDTYKSENGDIKVSVFNVNITEAALKKAIIKMFDSIIENKELSSYVSMFAMAQGETVDSLKKSFTASINKADMGFDEIPLTIYINENKEIVKTIFNIDSEYSKGSISIESIGKENINDYIVAQIKTDETGFKFTSKNQNNEFDYKIDVMPLNNGELIDDMFVSVMFKGNIVSETSSKKQITIEKIAVTGKMPNETLDILLSGNYEFSSGTTLASVSNTKFSNAIDYKYITEAEITKLIEEITNNISNLQSKLSTPVYNMLANIFLISSNNSLITN